MMSENTCERKSGNHDCDGGEISLARERWFLTVLSLRCYIKFRVQFVRSRRKASSDNEVSSITDKLLPTDPPHSSDQLTESSSSRGEHVVEKKPDNEVLSTADGIGVVASVPCSDLANGNKAVEALEVYDTADGFFSYFLKAFSSPTIVLLLISAGLSFGIEMKEQGPRYGWHDGAAILFALFVLVLFRSVSDCVNERNLQKKRHKKQNKLEFEVTRNGVKNRFPVSDLKEGDIVNLKMGDLVPADGLFVNGKDLELDEVLNSKIDGDVNPSLFSGSKVSKGEGRMRVTSVGSNTLTGKDLSLVNEDSSGRILLEKKIGKPSAFADHLGLFVTVLIAFVVLVRLVCEGQQENDDLLPELKGNTKIRVLTKIFEILFLRPTGRVRILASTLTAVVIGIQQTMPLAVTISLSCWNEKVKSLGSKVRNSSATGTMGLVTVICINITGGFMCDIVEVENFFIGEEDVKNQMDSDTDLPIIEALCQGIYASTCVPGLYVSNWAKSLRSVKSPGHEHRRLSADDNGSSVLLKKEGEGDDENSEFLHMEGEASRILNLCSHYYNSRGELHAIKDYMRNFEHIISEMEKDSLRAIAFACKKADISNADEDGLRLLALAGLKYSCSDHIKTTMKDVKDTGVCIKLVSGDELSIARAVAHELGIIEHDLNVETTGEQFRDLDEAARKEKIKQIALIGSCLPEDLFLVVQSLKDNDHVVAFVGGSSVTDIPVLKAADIGISKEAWSTEMVREISDIVITNEQSLPTIMQFGKCSYLNIQKFAELQLTVCISGLVINLVAAMCSWDSPLTAIQMFWVNLVMCLLGALMMAMDLNRERQSDMSSVRTQPMVTPLIWKHILIQALHQASVLLILHLVGLAVPSMTEAVWKSLVFNSFMLCQIFNLFKAMNMFEKEVIQTLLSHYWFWASAAIVLVVQVLFVQFAKSLAASARLSSIYWAISVIVAALPWTSECALRIIFSLFRGLFSQFRCSRRVRTLSSLPC